MNPAGHVVKLITSHTKHHDGALKKTFKKDDVSSSFQDALTKSLGKVNDLQVKSEGLIQKMIYNPKEVDIHTVMIAAQKAEVSLNFTKAIRDEGIRAYRELMNLR